MTSPSFARNLARVPIRPAGPAIAVLVVVALAATAALPVSAQVRGISYTFSPVYDAVRWDDDLGLEDTELYGGRLGLNFGRYLGLHGYYLTRSDVDTEVGRLDLVDGLGEPLQNRELDIENYGADLILNLNDGAIIPFVKAGGGVMRFDGPGTEPLNQINLKLGGGIRFGIDRFQGELFVEDSAFRIDRTHLGVPVNTTPPVPPDPEADEVRHNLSFGAGLTFFLGGHDGNGTSEIDRAIADRYQSGLRGLSIPIEPYVGRLNFSDEIGLDDQELLGLRTGVDLGRLVGLRGYYWRGMNDDFDDTEDIQSYGGEVQFNLSSGRGAVPYLTAGVGHLDFLDDYGDTNGVAPGDKTMLILGGGIGFTLGDRIRLDISARDYVLSETLDPEDVTTTDELFSNWMFSAGFRFSLGGGGDRPRPTMGDRGDERMRAEAMERADDRDRDETRDQDRDRDEYRDRGTDRDKDRDRDKDKDYDRKRKDRHERWDGRREMRTITEEDLPPTRDYHGDRIVALPVPTEGEIYVRYGRPGGVSIRSMNESGGEAPPLPPGGAYAPRPEAPDEDELRSAVRDELAAAGLTRQPAAPSGDLSDMEERLVRRIDERLDRIESRLGDIQDRPRDRGRTVVVTEDDDHPDAGDGDVVVYTEEEPYSWSPQAVRPYTGLNLDDPTQVLLGGKLDMGPVTRDSKFHFLPELVFGFGDDVTTFMAAGNLQVNLGSIGESGTWSPHAGAGLGILNFSADEDDHREGVLNLYYGITGRFDRWTVFAEHQGVDLFDLNRLLLGVRLGL